MRSHRFLPPISAPGPAYLSPTTLHRNLAALRVPCRGKFQSTGRTGQLLCQSYVCFNSAVGPGE